jgi:hypothetical protein
MLLLMWVLRVEDMLMEMSGLNQKLASVKT